MQENEARSKSESRRRRGQKGNSLLEFALVMVFLTPLLLQSFSVGMLLVKSLQVNQVGRTAGVLFLKYIDLSLPANQDMVVRTAQGLGMTRTGGNGMVVLSQVMYIGDAQCAAGNLTPANCPNYHRTVFLKRIVIGNAGLTIPASGQTAASQFGTPSSSIVGTDGAIQTLDYLRDISAVANNLPGNPSLGDGEMAFISEAIFLTPDLDMPGVSAGKALRSRPYIS